MSTAKAVGYLDLNINGFDQAIKTAKNLMAGLAATFAAYKIADFFKDGIKDAIDFGKEMQGVSRAMGGIDPGALLLTQKALERTGMGAQEAQGHIADFITQGRDLKQLFGGSENFAKGIKQASADYGNQAGVLSRSAQTFMNVWNSIESIAGKVRGFFMELTEGFILPFQSLLDYLQSIDISKQASDFGKSIGDALTTLEGVIKNGDMMEVLKLGVTIAFQEGVNYPVGGIKYIGQLVQPELGGKLMDAFTTAAEGLWKLMRFIFSVDGLATFGQALISAGAGFIAFLLQGMNKVVKVLQAGLNFGIQSAIEAVPGLSSMMGMGEHQSFSEIYNDVPELISPDVIDTFKIASKEFSDAAGGKFKTLMDELTGPSAKSGKFEKGTVFDTEEASKKMADLIAKGFKTGEKMNEEAKNKERGADPKKVLTSFSGSSSKVIADSLAKVGGGGGYLRAGMSLQERTQLEQLRAQKQGNQTLDVIRKNTESRQRAATLPR